jgi:hypothetical protein
LPLAASQDNYIPKYDASSKTVSWEADASGGTTAWDDIADPDADGTVAFAGYEQIITSTLDEASHSVLTITNTDADRAAATTILALKDNDTGDAEATYLDLIADADGTPASVFSINQNTGVVTTLPLSSDDITITGSDLSVGTAGVKLTGDGDGAITFLGLGNGYDEDLTVNLDDTENTAVLSSITGVTSIDTGSINLVSTGYIAAGVKRLGTFASPITNVGTYSLAAANCYNTVIFYNDTDTLALPAAVAGMNLVIYVAGANLTTIDPDGTDVIVVDGTANGAGDAFTVAGVSGNYISLVADAVNHWVTLGSKGTISAL